MASIDKACDTYQGYNFKRDVQTTVGFITSLKIGDKELAADQLCSDPENPSEDLEVVAVLSQTSWGTGVTDALYFAGQISAPNKQEIAMLLLSDLTKVDVTGQFAVYDYDLVGKAYFKSFHSDNTDMNGLVEKSGDDLTIGVAEEPSGEVESPVNFAFYVGVMPQPEAQSVHLATSVTAKVAKTWGLKVG
jgi:hypothetical protein